MLPILIPSLFSITIDPLLAQALYIIHLCCAVVFSSSFSLSPNSSSTQETGNILKNKFAHVSNHLLISLQLERELSSLPLIHLYPYSFICHFSSLDTLCRPVYSSILTHTFITNMEPGTPFYLTLLFWPTLIQSLKSPLVFMSFIKSSLMSVSEKNLLICAI